MSDKFVDNMPKMEKARRSRLTKDFNRLLFKIGGEAQRLAPVKEGYLRSSMAINLRKVKDGFLGLVFFLVPYAAQQHENESYNHPLGGEAKFLEKAIDNNRDELNRIAGDLRG